MDGQSKATRPTPSRLRDVLQIEPIKLGMWLLLVPITASVLLVMEIDKALRGWTIDPRAEYGPE